VVSPRSGANLCSGGQNPPFARYPLTVNRGRPRHDDVLTPREWEVLDLLREGMTNEQIADRLGIAHNTVKFHVSEILAKLEVDSRDEAAAWQGRPKVAFGLSPVAAVVNKLGMVSPLKLAGAGAIAAVTAGLVLLALGLLMGDSDESLGKIAFVRDGNIWVQELPDGAPYQLTDKGASSMPRWSPSGEWLLYSVRDENAETPPGIQLWIVKSDGSNERLLTDNGYTGFWLPDTGDRILYYTDDEETVTEAPAGSDRQVLYEPFIDGDERVVRFPFDGPGIQGLTAYFESRYPANPGFRDGPGPDYQALWVSDEDGSNARELTSIGALTVEQETSTLPYGWTAAGTHLLIVEIPSGPDEQQQVQEGLDLRALPVDGGAAIDLGLNVVLTQRPASSPNGLALVTGARQETWTDKRIALLAPDASGHTFLTEPEVAAIAPAWSPDGSRIAYVAAPDLGPDRSDEALASRRIWLMDADGSNKQQVTTGEGFRDASPMWSTDGRYVVFARLGVEDACSGSPYDLMLYDLEDASLEALASDLPLGGTMNERTDAGEVPACDWTAQPYLTDTFGNLNLSPILHWWRPQVK
jgi:DNA-binding CsgD family transcriptional regulator